MSNSTARPSIQRDKDPKEFLADLETHILKAFQILRGFDRVAVLFSGGVDSALAALLTQRHCRDTLLITARCEDSHDARVAKKAAARMSLNHLEVRIDSDSVWENLPIITRLINNTSKMNVEIAIPFFFAAREASSHGYGLMVSGQGPDELFAGYARYEDVFMKKGPEAVEDALWEDFSVTDERNLQRDMRVVEHHGLSPFFPYMHPDFVNTALAIPASMNIDPTKKPSRKLMFRELAEKMGVPREIAMQQKRATQYSSGTSKMLIQSLRDHVKDLAQLSRRMIESRADEILKQISHRQSTEV